MKFLYSIPVDYNVSGITELDKWKFLASPPFSFQLTSDNQNFTVMIKYNHGSRWPSLSIYDSNGELVQGETYMALFPTNLIVASAMRKNALYWQPELQRFDYYEIDDDAKWYNSSTLTEEEAYNIINRRTF